MLAPCPEKLHGHQHLQQRTHLVSSFRCGCKSSNNKFWSLPNFLPTFMYKKHPIPGDSMWPFTSPSWRSLNHLKGSLNHPKRGHQQNCQVLDWNFHKISINSLHFFGRIPLGKMVTCSSNTTCAMYKPRFFSGKWLICQRRLHPRTRFFWRIFE